MRKRETHQSVLLRRQCFRSDLTEVGALDARHCVAAEETSHVRLTAPSFLARRCLRQTSEILLHRLVLLADAGGSGEVARLRSDRLFVRPEHWWAAGALQFAEIICAQNT